MAVHWHMLLPGGVMSDVAAGDTAHSAKTDWVWIDSQQALAELLEHCLQLPAVALDTEFMRTDTFYPQLALLQINDGRQGYLIDPLALPDLQVLLPLLQSPSVVKVLHAPTEDLEIFIQLFQKPLEAVFDVQLAAAYCGHRPQMSLQNLLKTLLDVEVSKSESRSNWLARPLSHSQLIYAAEDVKYLLEAYDLLRPLLHANDRQHWLDYEMTALQQVQLSNDSGFDRYVYKLSAAADLDCEKQYILQQLCIWRESLARKVNKPRGHLVSDKALIEICQRLPLQRTQLYELEHLPAFAARKYGDILLDLIEQAQQAETPMLAVTIDRPLSIAEGKVHKKLKQLVKREAQKLGVEASLIFKKADYLALLKTRDAQGHYHWPESICDWRSDLLSSVLLAGLNGGNNEKNL